MAEKAILQHLNSSGVIVDSRDFSASVGFDHEDICNAIRSLQGDQLVVAEQINTEDNTWISFSVSKGPQFALERKQVLATDLTREHLQRGGNWENLELEEYNFNAAIAPLECGGHLPPLLKVREQMINIFIEMGFEQMPSTINGGYGSKGYGYDCKKREEAVLRTHTTAVSGRMLHQLAQGPFTPKRYFSVDRAFRNDHLAEFHYQIEGVVCDRGLTLVDLMGVLNDFFERLGMKNLRFKPTYNPCTEPIMGIYSYHGGLKKWVEVGNAGMFRPEMLLPMGGLPEDVTCIEWALSLERPAMILHGIDNIRDLFGH